jgi:tetratricopeptide (TPR) repeat protein
MYILSNERLKYLIIFILIFSLPLLLMPEPGWVLAQEQTGDDLLEQGKQYYQEGKFEETVEKLTLALKMLSDKDKLVDAYLHMALSHFALGEKEKAKQDLAELLRLDPTHKLDPMYYPPDFVQLLDEAKGAILAHITIETEPTEAQVYLDGELKGLSPLELQEVAAGEHKLVVLKEGYKAQEQRLLVKEGEKRTVSFELEKKEEKKRPAVAVTPKEKKPEVKKSKSWLWILLGGAAAAAIAILASRGGKETGGPTPTPTTQTFGSIQVKSYPNGASIFLNGQNTGFKTNHTLTNIPTGNHTILLRLAGWKDWQEEVVVNANQKVVVKPCLLPPNGCFRDNFQDGDTDGWDLPNSYKLRNEGGNYFLEGNGDGFARPSVQEWRNFSLKFKFKLLYTRTGHFSADFRTKPNEDRYRLLITEDGVWIDKNINEEQINFTDSFRHIITKGRWYNINIVVEGDNIKVYFDNSLKINIYDHHDTIDSGGFMFFLYRDSGAQIDDVLMTSNECP